MALDPEYETILNACLSNADFDEDGDLTKAKAYRTACRQRLHYAEKMSKGQSGAEFNLAEVRRELQRVTVWIEQRDSASRPTRNRFVRGRPPWP